MTGVQTCALPICFPVTIPRQVSTVYYVNDNYSGGELTFPYIDLTIKPMAGELIVFPSTNMFSHQAEKIIEGTKYSLANWFN